MKCPKCNSENINIQVREHKLRLALPMCLIGAGIGMFFFGIGAIIGAPIGLIIGLIIQSVSPSGNETIMVCQNCGYVSQPLTQTNISTKGHLLFCPSEDSNLDIIRNDVDKGTIVIIRVKIDGYEPIDIQDNSVMTLKLPVGEHIVSYEQLNGIGRKKNNGRFNIVINEKKAINISFTRQGLNVKHN